MNKENEFFIPENYDTDSEFLGIPYRNIVEGLILAAILIWLEWKIPFVAEIKLTIAVILFFVPVIICSIGIKGESVSQFLYACIVFFFKNRRLHLKVTGTTSTQEEKLLEEEKEKEAREEKIEAAKEKATTLAKKFTKKKEVRENEDSTDETEGHSTDGDLPE